MHLDEFAVGVVTALLIKRRLRRAGADHRICRLAKDCADSAGGDDHRVRRESPHLHGVQVNGADAAAYPAPIEHGGEKFPVLVLGDPAFRFEAAHLLIERIQELLPGGGAGEGGAMEQSATEPAEIEQSLGGPIEGDAHAVQQIDDAGRRLAHVFYRRLVSQEVAAVHGVVKVLPGGIALALQVLGGVDAALRANRM